MDFELTEEHRMVQQMVRLQLAALAAVLVAAAGLTAALSGRAATGVGALRAVREDW